MFTEKKTDRYTAVVSVAVKAITVARGYVGNEGTGHELGFQPYLRGEGGGSMVGGGGGGGGKGPGSRSSSASAAGLGEHSTHEGRVEGPQAQEQGGRQRQRQRQQGLAQPQVSDRGREGGLGGEGAEPAGLVDEDAVGGVGVDTEQAEMAFDVFKLPQVGNGEGEGLLLQERGSALCCMHAVAGGHTWRPLRLLEYVPLLLQNTLACGGGLPPTSHWELH